MAALASPHCVLTEKYHSMVKKHTDRHDKSPKDPQNPACQGIDDSSMLSVLRGPSYGRTSQKGHTRCEHLHLLFHGDGVE